MKHKRSCDTHPKYQAGCEPCNRVSRHYHERRKLIRARGGTLSVGSAQVIDWLRQLRAAGHTSRVIQTACGANPPNHEYLTDLANGQGEWVQLRVFFAVQQAYRELSPFPGVSVRARNVARKNGWTPPPPLPIPEGIGEDTVDDVAVRRVVIHGERVPLTRAETLEAWRQLEATGMTAGRIGARLHVDERTINRWRSGKIPASRRTA